MSLIIGIGIGIGGYALSQKNDDSTEPSATTSQVDTTSSSSATIPAGWKTVTNSTGHYSFAYPTDWERLAVFEAGATSAVGSPSTVKYLTTKPGTEVSPDFEVIYYAKSSEMRAIDKNGNEVTGFESLASFIKTVQIANTTDPGKTEPRTFGQYNGYYSDQLPGIGSTDYLIEANGHVYDLRVNQSEQTTIDQIVATFRLTE